MDDDFEVRGLHEQLSEERATGGEAFDQRIALFTAILATLAAVTSFLGGHTQNEALLHKNEAVLIKAQASDAWGYYQAEDLKRHIAQMEVDLAPPGFGATQMATHRADIARYKARGTALKREAETLDRRSVAADGESDEALRPHTKLALAVTAIQVAIALASITALTGRRWLLWVAGAAALVGALLAGLAWF
ncbi:MULTISPECIES: DUF4337 domain-containing protein [unclassified Sphingomonas]|uniref:DUF4337 domain-containing protein n=1 Tax=unclassified Sphingomonas TaxID=196159 RepID=UPI0006FFB1F3|nr:MULTISPECIES: DUF4337 domain-containing protein [unclassified Sphingomonas]KQS48106.1 hypothetical protein ASG20_13295 [Sphingomonas sp. Leaf198]